MIGTCVNFINWLQKIRGALSAKMGPKHAKFRTILHNLRLWSRISPEWLEISNKKVQQSWQTSALAMHLHPARLVSMPVIFCLLSSSSIIILVFYLFSTGISEQHAWELWVWIQSESTGLTLPLRVTPMNNPITLISPVQSLGYIFVALTVICVALQISE